MSLLEVISKASAESQSLHSPSEYPIVLDPDSIFPNLKPKLDDPNPISAAIPLTNWQISQTDPDLIDLGKKFTTNLKKKLKNPVKFDKAEFLGMVNAFLEKIREKVGGSIRVVDSSNEGYTWVLVEKVGEYMGKDVAGLVLDACVVLEVWESVGALTGNGLVSSSCYVELVAKIVEKRMTELVCMCLTYASDLGSKEDESAEMGANVSV